MQTTPYSFLPAALLCGVISCAAGPRSTVQWPEVRASGAPSPPPAGVTNAQPAELPAYGPPAQHQTAPDETPLDDTAADDAAMDDTPANNTTTNDTPPNNTATNNTATHDEGTHDEASGRETDLEPNPYDTPASSSYDSAADEPSSSPPPDAWTDALALVDKASHQIQRLQRTSATSTDERRLSVDGALINLQTRRDRVLDDMRLLGTGPGEHGAQAPAALAAGLDTDVGDLRDALRASMGILLPPEQGLPAPAPLPPSEAGM